MTLGEVAAELDRMNQQEAEEYDTILCNELFSAFCYSYLKYKRQQWPTRKFHLLLPLAYHDIFQSGAW